MQQLPFIEHLQLIAKGNVPVHHGDAPTTVYDADMIEESYADLSGFTQHLMRAQIFAFFIANDQLDSTDEILVREREKLVRIIARQLYGPIVDKLIDLRVLLTRTRGLSVACAELAIIDELIDVMEVRNKSD